LVLLLVAMVAIFLGPRMHRFVRERTQKVLETHFASTVEFSDCDVTLFPRLHVNIAGLVLRHNGRSDIPPLIQVRTVSIYAQWPGLLRPIPHISFVQLDGLQIHAPPRVPGVAALIRKTDASPEYVAALDKYGMVAGMSRPQDCPCRLR
jgi:hypothetical protein